MCDLLKKSERRDLCMNLYTNGCKRIVYHMPILLIFSGNGGLKLRKNSLNRIVECTLMPQIRIWMDSLQNRIWVIKHFFSSSFVKQTGVIYPISAPLLLEN